MIDNLNLTDFQAIRLQGVQDQNRVIANYGNVNFNPNNQNAQDSFYEIDINNTSSQNMLVQPHANLPQDLPPTTCQQNNLNFQQRVPLFEGNTNYNMIPQQQAIRVSDDTRRIYRDNRSDTFNNTEL